MLGVEHGQVLVGDGLEARRIDAARQRGHLRGVQIVRGSERLRPSREQQVRRDRVGRVQAEIADQPHACRAQCLQQARGAHQDRAIAAQQEIDDALLARLQDARAGDARLDAGGFHALERGPQAVQIEIIERDAGGRSASAGIQLLGGAHQKVEFAARQRGSWFRRG